MARLGFCISQAPTSPMNTRPPHYQWLDPAAYINTSIQDNQHLPTYYDVQKFRLARRNMKF
ncbi:uncharacterized protein BDV17DRAFT_254691 [Aspergillus undulatus]|uniref:uncharacterized protein n=1 Tax=Aspergillus undulatus TaxID=1810928 RepID=UPI003CCD7803